MVFLVVTYALLPLCPLRPLWQTQHLCHPRNPRLLLLPSCLRYSMFDVRYSLRSATLPILTPRPILRDFVPIRGCLRSLWSLVTSRWFVLIRVYSLLLCSSFARRRARVSPLRELICARRAHVPDHLPCRNPRAVSRFRVTRRLSLALGVLAFAL